VTVAGTHFTRDETDNSIRPTPRSEFINGMKAVIPLIVGGIPFDVIFGVSAIEAGLSPAAVQGMSLFIFAGSAQFIGVGMMAAGAATGFIILTTFIVNLRHSLYAATLAPHVRGLSQRWLLPLGFMLTDESFVMAIGRYNQPDNSPYKHYYFLGANLAMYVTWQIFTFVGIVLGSSIPNIENWGLDFALPAAFIAMLVPQLTSRPMLLAAVVAGLVALAAHSLPNQMGLMVAALAGVIAGVIAERIWLPAETEETAS